MKGGFYNDLFNAGKRSLFLGFERYHLAKEISDREVVGMPLHILLLSLIFKSNKKES
jgi:hypothetical protein